MILLDGLGLANSLYEKLDGKKHILAIITIGEDYASSIYVRNKIKACEKANLVGKHYQFSEGTEYKVVSNLIRELNNDDKVSGIIVQQPYPKEFKGIENEIEPFKDVDGLTDTNMFKTLIGEEPIHYPATPSGIITILDNYKIPIEGKNVVVIGRSNIVGKPLSAMMSARNATVTLCHSKTDIEILKFLTSYADIIISAVGKPKFLNKSFLEQDNDGGFITMNNPIIIDIGINRDKNGNICGDVDFESVKDYCYAITPVPKGVGPMTVYSLIYNTVKYLG